MIDQIYKELTHFLHHKNIGDAVHGLHRRDKNNSTIICNTQIKCCLIELGISFFCSPEHSCSKPDEANLGLVKNFNCYLFTVKGRFFTRIKV